MKKQTTDKVSTLSARVMSELRAARKEKGGTKKDASDFVTLGELWALAASKGGRETTDRVSRIAAKVMRALRGFASPHAMVGAYSDDGRPVAVYVRDVAALAGSCLTQDTTPGKRPAKRGRK